MKMQNHFSVRRFTLALCLLLPGICFAPSTPVCPDCGQTYDNGPDGTLTGEFAANGDFNGDGREDFLLLDKATGAWRPALANAADDGFTFGEVQSAGMTGISGMALGNFLDVNTIALGVASPTMNRVHLLALNTTAPQPEVVRLPTVAPSVLGPLDVPGTVNNALEELNVAFDAGVTGSFPRHLLRRSASGSWFSAGSTTMMRRPLRLGRIAAKPDVPALGAMLEDGAGARFELWTAGSDALTTAASLSALPASTRFASGAVETTATDVFFYTRGSGTVRTSRISEPSSGVFALSATVVRNLAHPVQSIFVTMRGAVTELLVTYTDQSAEVLGYTAAGGFSVRQSLPVVGMGVMGAVPLHDAGFVLLSSAAGDTSGLAGIARRFKHDGTSYQQVWQGTLPGVKALELAGNVLFFDKHPLADGDAMLYAAARARHWSSNGTLDGTGNYTVTSEAYANPQVGLANPLMSSPTPVPSPTSNQAVVVSNQITPDVSLFALEPMLGAKGDEVTVDPPGGNYDASVKVTLAARQANTTLHWRTASNAAFQSGTQPPAFFTDTTLEFYGQAVDGTLTPRQSAAYTFRRTPPEQDSDGDGVPDFVERALGMDPDGSLSENGSPSDYDGDGYSDLDELLAGGTADPADPTKVPASGNLRTDTGGDKLALTVIPRGLRVNAASQVLENTAAVGTVVQVHDTTGTLLSEGTVQVVNGVRQADLTCTGVHDRQRVLIVSTQTHFSLPYSAGEPNPAGREICGVLPVPALVPVSFVFVFDANADLAAEAQRWIAARRAAGSASRPAQTLTIDYRTTAKLVLLERLLRDLGAMRGVLFSDSLTPFRDGGGTTANRAKGLSFESMDKLASAPTHWSTLQEIRAWRIADLFAYANAQLTNPASDPLLAVNDMARDVYRISAALHNDTPGHYALPLDALREFVARGVLDAAYTAQTTVPEARRMTVAGGMYAVSFAAPQRPVFQGNGAPHMPLVDATLQTTFTTGGTGYNLVQADASPWRFPGSFGLTSSTRVEVTGFSDMGTTADRTNLEVIAARVTGFDLGTPTDADGNLLGDAWERYFLGGTGWDAFAQWPGTAYPLLQLYLAGADPWLVNGLSLGAPVDLRLTGFHIEQASVLPPRTLRLRWQFPAGYGPAFRFGVQESTDLRTFADTALEGTETAAGAFDVVMPQGAGNAKFFRVVTRLQ
jgi:hypothetical protein